MEGMPLKKSSVAWFKLAECVERGDRERALDLYRLLTHSHDSKAFMKKLEADIMVAFDFDQALKEYIQAAHWYLENNQLSEAAFIYEQIVVLSPSTLEYVERLVDLYAMIGREDKQKHYKLKMHSCYLLSGKIAKAVTAFEEVEEMIEGIDKLQFYRDFVIQALTHRYTNQKIITSFLHKGLDGLIRFGTDSEMKAFLGDLQALNTVWYKDATDYISKS